jgi:hypothetical protein
MQQHHHKRAPGFDIPEDSIEFPIPLLGPAPSPAEGSHPCHARSVTIIDAAPGAAGTVNSPAAVAAGAARSPAAVAAAGAAPGATRVAAAPPPPPAAPLWRRLLTRR